MKVNEWVQTYWTIINIKPKTLFDYKGLYRRNLEPCIGDCEIDEVSPLELQTVLLGLPLQTSRHTLMVAGLRRKPSSGGYLYALFTPKAA